MFISIVHEIIKGSKSIRSEKRYIAINRPKIMIGYVVRNNKNRRYDADKMSMCHRDMIFSCLVSGMVPRKRDVLDGTALLFV